MNVVVAGDNVQIYGESIKTYQKLPVGFYTVRFNKMSGFSLQLRSDLKANEEKIYGKHEDIVHKIFKSYELFDRNFGIILSGEKGIGKSLIARMIAETGTKKGYPVIIVDESIQGLADFLSSIEQEVIVIFDEFEKNFGDDETDEECTQEELLSLFDGMDSGKKMFIITCNRVWQLSDYLIDRPGRFHYHIKLDRPNDGEIAEYMHDKLNNNFKNKQDVIEKVCRISKVIKINYDCLRAIVFELNQGYSLNETIRDLNIAEDTSQFEYDIIITTIDGSEFVAEGISIDITNPNMNNYYFHRKTDNDYLVCLFRHSDIKVTKEGLHLSPDLVCVDTQRSMMPEELKDKQGIIKSIRFRTETDISFDAIMRV